MRDLGALLHSYAKFIVPLGSISQSAYDIAEFNGDAVSAMCSKAFSSIREVSIPTMLLKTKIY